MKLYSELRIKTEKVSYAASFTNNNEDSYFQYKNLRIGRFSLPFVKSRYLIRQESRRIIFRYLSTIQEYKSRKK